MTAAEILLAVGALIGAGGGIAAVVLLPRQRRQLDATAAQALSAAAVGIVNELQEEATKAKAETAESRRETAEARRETSELRRETAVLRTHIQELTAQVEQLQEALRTSELARHLAESQVTELRSRRA